VRHRAATGELLRRLPGTQNTDAVCGESVKTARGENYTGRMKTVKGNIRSLPLYLSLSSDCETPLDGLPTKKSKCATVSISTS